MGTKDNILFSVACGIAVSLLFMVVWALLSSPGSGVAILPAALMALIIYIWVKQMFFGGFGV